MKAESPTPTASTRVRGCLRRVAMIGMPALGCALLRCEELGGFVDSGADDDADDEQEDRGEERQAPAPGDEGIRAHGCQGAGDDERGDELTGGRAGAGEAGPEAAVLGGVLCGHEHGAAPFAADRNSLDDADEDEEDRCDEPGLVIGGQQADRCGGDADGEHADDEHAFAAEFVAEVAEDDAAQRTSQIAGGECGQAGQCADGRGEVGEEDVLEDKGGADGVDEEVVVLDDAAQVRRGGCSLEHRCRFRWRGVRGSHVILADCVA